MQNQPLFLVGQIPKCRHKFLRRKITHIFLNAEIYC